MIKISDVDRQSQWSRRITQPRNDVMGFNEPAEVNDGKVFGFASALWTFQQLSNWK